MRPRTPTRFNLLVWLLPVLLALGSVATTAAAQEPVYGGTLIVGLAENLSVLVMSAGYKQAMPFIILIVVLYFRPQGLFGSRERS